jgi:methylmalonyl-CoA mutase
VNDGPPGTATLDLQAAFPPAPTDAWEAAIARDLKGADYEKRLVWRPEAGLAIRPYYRRQDVEALGEHVAAARPGAFPFLRGVAPGWEILDTWRPSADTVRADLWHDAGASTVQEVAFAIAAGVDRVASLTDEGATAEEAVGRIHFGFAIGSAFFLEIAKLRAARLLWAQACSAFGITGDAALMRIDARTARANKSVYDPYTNLLRVTTEACSAVLGGCRRLFIEPFGFDRHLATNVHHILREEAHLAVVADAGGGAYYLEVLTDGLAREAWTLFQRIEGEGGFAAAMDAGTIDRLIATSRDAQARAVSTRRRTLVGVNNYPNLMDREPAAEPPPLPGAESRPRLAAPFEAIRRRTAAYASKTGRRPLVALLRHGDPKMAGARANFSLNFFGCAGFDVADGDAAAGEPDLVVLCSADPEYLALARDVVPRTTAPVIVAGNPVSELDALRAAGVQGFVHLGSDAVQTLTEWQDRLGVA